MQRLQLTVLIVFLHCTLPFLKGLLLRLLYEAERLHRGARGVCLARARRHGCFLTSSHQTRALETARTISDLPPAWEIVQNRPGTQISLLLFALSHGNKSMLVQSFFL